MLEELCVKVAHSDFFPWGAARARTMHVVHKASNDSTNDPTQGEIVVVFGLSLNNSSFQSIITVRKRP